MVKFIQAALIVGFAIFLGLISTAVGETAVALRTLEENQKGMAATILALQKEVAELRTRPLPTPIPVEVPAPILIPSDAALRYLKVHRIEPRIGQLEFAIYGKKSKK